MRTIALAIIGAAALTPQLVLSASFLAPSLASLDAPFSGMNNTEEVIGGRRLKVLTEDDICKDKTGKLVKGYRELYRDGRVLGSLYAFCDGKQKPKCYFQVEVADRKEAPVTVDCAKALKIINASRSKSRRLATYRQGVSLWPKGVVCYNFMHTRDRAIKKKYPDNRKLIRKVKKIMRAYTEGTQKAVKFIHITDCKLEAGHCGGCTHFVNFETEVKDFDSSYSTPTTDANVDSHNCWSMVGYRPGNSRERKKGDEIVRKNWDPLIKHDPRVSGFLERLEIVHDVPSSKIYTYQPLNLSPACWNELEIGHEIGHTLGLRHDHQRNDRKIILLLEAAKQMPWKDIMIRHGGPGQIMHGVYDEHSIMHYAHNDNDDDFLCLPKDGPDDPKPARFCDWWQTEANGCIEGTKAHCAHDQSALLRPKTYMPRPADYDVIRRLYTEGPPAVAGDDDQRIRTPSLSSTGEAHDEDDQQIRTPSLSSTDDADGDDGDDGDDDDDDDDGIWIR